MFRTSYVHQEDHLYMQFCTVCFSYIFVSSLAGFIDTFVSPVERWLFLCFFFVPRIVIQLCNFNPLKTKRRPLYLKTQCVPRSELKSTQL
jgi:hypothetical protein